MFVDVNPLKGTQQTPAIVNTQMKQETVRDSTVVVRNREQLIIGKQQPWKTGFSTSYETGGLIKPFNIALTGRAPLTLSKFTVNVPGTPWQFVKHGLTVYQHFFVREGENDDIQFDADSFMDTVGSLLGESSLQRRKSVTHS